MFKQHQTTPRVFHSFPWVVPWKTRVRNPSRSNLLLWWLFFSCISKEIKIILVLRFSQRVFIVWIALLRGQLKPERYQETPAFFMGKNLKNSKTRVSDFHVSRKNHSMDSKRCAKNGRNTGSTLDVDSLIWGCLKTADIDGVV